MKRSVICVLAALCVFFSAMASRAETAPAAPVKKEYTEVTQAELSSSRTNFDGKDVLVSGQFLFTGSDFCYKIRGTKINTLDYFCFTLGPVSLVRFYLKKDHPQVEELLKVKKGMVIKAYGNFDSMGNDYKYVVVDHFVVLPK